jgi:hypothetical protein
MFQDEARFGRMVRIRRCWAPKPQRPVVSNGYERQFLYVYGAVSPMQGQFDWMITRQMNTTNMSEFLAQVSAAHPRDFIVMVVDGASSHVAKDLVVPKNMRLLRLPPYAPFEAFGTEPMAIRTASGFKSKVHMWRTIASESSAA